MEGFFSFFGGGGTPGSVDALAERTTFQVTAVFFFFLAADLLFTPAPFFSSASVTDLERAR